MMRKEKNAGAASLSRRDFLKKTALIGGAGLAMGPISRVLGQDTDKPAKPPRIFEPARIGKLMLKNRLVRSATAERLADKNGAVTDQMVALYKTLAAGGVGTIITGHAFVRPDGRLGATMMGIDQDSCVEGVNRLVKTAHGFDTKLFVQINHAGIKAEPDVANPLTPSIPAKRRGAGKPKEMTAEDIEQVVQAFGAAAKRVRDGGADGVQIHAAHGFLVNQFLTPLVNMREDDWGGTAEKRLKFLLAVYDCVRKAVGADFPVWTKLNGQEFFKGGRPIEECLQAAAKLAEKGIDAIEISGLGGKGPARREETEEVDETLYYVGAAEQFRPKLKTPLDLVGGIRRLETMEMLIAEKGLDLISMARPFIREPDLPNKLQSGRAAKAECISCSECLRKSSEPIKCWQKQKKEK